jgi:hypothetical protein
MIAPWVAAALVLLALLPAAASLWARPQPQRFAAMVAYSCLCGFWLGYHVHEKAILPVRCVCMCVCCEILVMCVCLCMVSNSGKEQYHVL